MTAVEAFTGITEKEWLIAEALDNPALFAEVFLEQDLWSIQNDIMHSIGNNPRTAVKACHSSGKTFLAACAALAWIAKYPDGVVVTTAPTDMQVRTLLWGEIANACIYSKYPFPKPNQTSLKLTPKRYALGFSTSVTTQNEGVRFQGFHSGHILIILDEAPGVHPKIWDAIEGIRAGGKVSVLALGNPTINSGPFFDCFEKSREGWKTFTISAFDTPNMKGMTIADLLQMEQDNPEALKDNKRPYLTTRSWVLEKFKEWGETHPLYQSRVLGNFPTQAEDALLSLTWIEMAKLRNDQTSVEDDVYGGLDVAGPGEDDTVLTIRSKNKRLEQKCWPQSDPRGEVVAALMPYKNRLKSLNVDCIGIGWGMYQHLRDIFGACVNPVNVGEVSSDPEKFVNLKAELYWGLRLRFLANDIAGEFSDKEVAQLAGIRYKHNSRGQVVIESKEDLRKRGVKSPDCAESIMLAYARPLKPGAGLMEWMVQQLAAEGKTA